MLAADPKTLSWARHAFLAAIAAAVIGSDGTLGWSSEWLQ